MIKINPYIIRMYNAENHTERELRWCRTFEKLIENFLQVTRDNMNRFLTFSLDCTQPDRYVEENSLEAYFWE